MLTRLIYFLIRLKLGVKLRQHFRFKNQKSHNDYYFFEWNNLYKMEYRHPDPFYPHGRKLRDSGVSLNWLMDKDCEIVKLNRFAK